ncbi:MAG: hypothetical protein D6693_04430 [Planctomycetota bacterium]|nr:MAG: hypothetical protein D6693_04430 [Planctomycetota bacterium]
MTTPMTRRTSSPTRAPRRLIGVVGAAVSLAAVAGLALPVREARAASVESAKVGAPVEIVLTLDSDLPAYDLAWADHADAARAALAQQAIDKMDDPAALYLLRLPQVPVAWRPLPASFSTVSSASDTGGRRRSVAVARAAVRDMTGRAIDRSRARLGRIHYERDLEAALLDVVARIRAQRPGALLSLDQFVKPESYGARAGSYRDLIGELDFVVLRMPAAAPASQRVRSLSSRSRARVSAALTRGPDLDRALKMASPPDGLFALVETGGEWSAVDDEPLPEAVEAAAAGEEMQWPESDAEADADSADPPVLHAPDKPAPDPNDPGSFDGPGDDGPPIVIEPDTPDDHGSAGDDAPPSDDGGAGDDAPPVDQTPGSDGAGDDTPADQPDADTPPSDDDGAGDDAPADPPTDDQPADDDAPSDPSAGDDAPTDGVPGDDDNSAPPPPPADEPADDDDASPPPPPPPADNDDDTTTTNDHGGSDLPPAPPTDSDDAPDDDPPADAPGDDEPTGGSDDQPDDRPDTAGAAPVLIGGSGFTGPTPAPAPVGSGPGADAEAIARWDAVPYQTFDGTFDLGVVAFHINGIDRVEFSVDGGPWAPVYEMTFNERTGVWEYVARLDADEFDDGPVEVRAIAYPKVGVPRVLQDAGDAPGERSMVLFADADGSLPEKVYTVDAVNGDDELAWVGTPGAAFKTLRSVRERIRLDITPNQLTRIRLKSAPGGNTPAGVTLYDFAEGGEGLGEINNDRWIIIEPAPGADRDNIVVRPNGQNFRFRRWAIRDLKVWAEQKTLIGGLQNQRACVWLDGADVFSPYGRFGDGRDFFGAAAPGFDRANTKSWELYDMWMRPETITGGLYLTDTTVRDYPSRMAVVATEMLRGVRIERCQQDAMVNTLFVLNTSIRDVHPAPDSGQHPDGWQFAIAEPNTGDMNIVLYGVEMLDVEGQLLFSDRGFKNAAFVNILGVQTWDKAFLTQFGKESLPIRFDHLIFDHLTLPNSRFTLRSNVAMSPGSEFRNVLIANSVSYNFTMQDVDHHREGVVYRDSHTIDGTNDLGSIKQGTHTLGNPRFVNGSLGAFDPARLDYRPAPGSPLRGRVARDDDAPGDLRGARRRDKASIGAIEGD